MKCIKLLTFFAFVFVISSCSISKSVVRTGKIESLSPEIVQMPTVVELQIDQTPSKADTVVTTHFFKSIAKSFRGENMNRKELTDFLTGKILERAGADVLMEPKVKTEIFQDGLETTMKMEVEGYPAKYSNFRTITAEDVDILGRLNPGKTSTVSMARFLRSDAGRAYSKADNVLNVTDPVNKKPKKVKTKYHRKLGYTGIYELEFDIRDVVGDVCFSDYGEQAGVGLMTSQGVQFNPHVFLGGSTGLIYSFGQDGAETFNYFRIPFLVHTRFHLAKSRVAPFIDLKAGGALMIADEDGETETEVDPDFRAGFGISFGKFAIATDYEVGLYKFEGPLYMGFNVKIALTF